MKKALPFLFALGVHWCFAQLNVSFVSQLDYDVDANDIWGWVDPDDSTEYALVGLRDGVSIVSLADPVNPQEIAKIPGQPSTWRDLKTWGNFAYVTTDQPGTTDGLLVIDLSFLPDSVAYENITDFPGLGSLLTCHNLYIDEKGICYVAGCERNSGGIILFDVASEPGNPIFLGAGPPVYAHDVYTRNDRMYASEIYVGNITAYDVSDPTDIQLLGSRPTDFTFTHNAWLSDDGNTVFTTDERANAPVGAYDVSDPSDMVELDQFRPTATVGSGVIPHNVHVLNDYLVISYYTDGLVIADAARPGNLIEVGIYDTWTGPDGGFNGAWGAYPFLPSGLVLISDIQGGLFVLRPEYIRGCYLEGRITDAETGASINNAEVTIAAQQANRTSSGLDGSYRTGLAAPGSYSVTVTAFGYEPFSTQVSLQQGVVTERDIALQPLERVAQTGQVVQTTGGTAIAGAQVMLFNDEFGFDFVTTADTDGQFVLEDVFVGTYTLVAGAWGYVQQVVENVEVRASGDPIVVELPVGYEDDFILDLGWETQSTASTGDWERAIPVLTVSGGFAANPGEDVPGDIGPFAYVTDNGGGSAGDFDVDNGIVTLISPPMDLTQIEDPVLRFDAWFYNTGGSNPPPNDTLHIWVTNGTDTVLLEAVALSQSAWRAFEDIHLADFIMLTDAMHVIFQTSDLPGSGHLVEAGLDAFRIEGERNVTSVAELQPGSVRLQAAPVPFNQRLSVTYRWEGSGKESELRLVNSLGQVVWIRSLDHTEGQVDVYPDVPAGWYALGLYQGGRLLEQVRVLKSR